MSLGLSPFKAQAKLDNLPPTPEAIKYLMALVNGSNPDIPPYMALGRLEQMKHEMEKEAPQPPQGTVKDKTMQAAGIMALQGGQQQQAAQQMAQAAPQAMPVPQNVPQPQMQPQPEEVQASAGGGLMRARVDPRMFSFAPGGIVSFAGGGEFDTGSDETELALDKLRVEQIEQNKKEKEDKERMAFLEQSAPEVAARIKAEEAARIKAAEEARRPPAPAAPPPPSAKGSAPPSSGGPPAGGPRPPAGPRPAGNVGIAQALPPELEAMRPKTDPGYQSLLADSRGVADAYGRTVDAQRTKAERPLLESAQEMQLLDKQLGIGKYGEELDKTRTERAKRYEESKKTRDEKTINSMLEAFVTPGARAGDVAKARNTLRQKFEAADEEFSTAQEKMLLDGMKYREELAIGNRDKAFALRSDAEKALTTMAGKLAELRLGTFEQAIAYLKHGDNKTMEFNKAVLGFKTHQQEMAQKYSAQRDALKERIKQNQRAYDLRKEQLTFQYAKADVGANKKVLDELASRERMLEVQRGVAMNKGELEKADKFQDQLDELQSKRANILAPIAGRSEAMQGSGGITNAPGANLPARGGKTIDFNTGKETR
jgi:hypothetical protein